MLRLPFLFKLLACTIAFSTVCPVSAAERGRYSLPDRRSITGAILRVEATRAVIEMLRVGLSPKSRLYHMLGPIRPRIVAERTEKTRTVGYVETLLVYAPFMGEPPASREFVCTFDGSTGVLLSATVTFISIRDVASTNGTTRLARAEAK
jgi:hypothetical protein